MAVTPITPVDPTFNTASVDLPLAGTVATTPTDGWEIATGGKCNGRIILFFEANGSGDTVTIKAGDRPPAQDAGQGDDAITLAASDLRAYIPTGRFIQDDSTMLVTCIDTGTRCYALIIPQGGPGYPLT
jgi:hypothetical protein